MISLRDCVAGAMNDSGGQEYFSMRDGLDGWSGEEIPLGESEIFAMEKFKEAMELCDMGDESGAMDAMFFAMPASPLLASCVGQYLLALSIDKSSDGDELELDGGSSRADDFDPDFDSPDDGLETSRGAGLNHGISHEGYCDLEDVVEDFNSPYDDFMGMSQGDLSSLAMSVLSMAAAMECGRAVFFLALAGRQCGKFSAKEYLDFLHSSAQKDYSMAKFFLFEEHFTGTATGVQDINLAGYWLEEYLSPIVKKRDPDLTPEDYLEMRWDAPEDVISMCLLLADLKKESGAGEDEADGDSLAFWYQMGMGRTEGKAELKLAEFYAELPGHLDEARRYLELALDEGVSQDLAAEIESKIDSASD